MTAEEVAALLYASKNNLPGWAFPELIDWLNAEDNITDKVNMDLLDYCWRYYGGIRVSESFNR